MDYSLYKKYRRQKDIEKRYAIGRLIVGNCKRATPIFFWENTQIKSLPGERWRSPKIPSLQNIVLVSSLGRVMRISRRVKTGLKTQYRQMTKKIALPYITREGRVRYSFCIDGTIVRICGHQLVALAFWPNPNSLPQVNHIDGVPKNNHYLNLEWVSVSDNELHSFRVLGKTAKKLQGAASKNAKPVLRYDKSGVLVKRYNAVIEVLEDGFCKHHVSNAARGIGTRKSHGGYFWKYE